MKGNETLLDEELRNSWNKVNIKEEGKGVVNVGTELAHRGKLKI